MKCLVFCCLVIISCCQLVVAEPPGVCYVEYKVPNSYPRRRGFHIVTRLECCEGYKRSGERPFCDPICEPECQNADCEGVNLCVCLPGHMMVNNSTSTCVNICNSCVNSACAPDGDNDSECVCKAGYERDQNQPHVCNPICNPPCVNGTCDAPGVCSCFDKFVKEEGSHVCRPSCTKQCLFGDCTDVDECTCYQGYLNDEDQPNICVPTCSPACENGFCSEPDLCECYSGFKKILQNPFKCAPEGPEKLGLKMTCEFNISEALQNGKVSDCFLLKKTLVINETQCGLLKFLTDPKCTEDKNCRVSFRCSRNSNNGANEIHCDLDMNDAYFETEESSNVTLPEMDLTDVAIELNLFQPTSLDADFNTRRRVWELRRLSKWPVCGKKYFGVEIIETTNRFSSSATKGSNFLTYFLVLSSCIILLLGVIGVGLFLWRRHRRLNDPLNYKGGMVRGYHAKRGERDQPAELVPDDESD